MAILDVASPPFAIADGRAPPSAVVGNNTDGKPAVQIVNSYRVVVDANSLYESLVVDPIPHNLDGPAFFTAVATSLLFCDASGGPINIQMPPAPYPGMKMVVKHTSTSGLVTVQVVGNILEVSSAPGTYASTDAFSSVGKCVTWQWNAGHGLWNITSMF